MNGTVKNIEDPSPISYLGNLLVVTAKSPLPPGSRVKIELSTKDSTLKVCLTGKVVNIDPSAKGRFTVKVRLHSVTKDTEELLTSILSETE